MRKKKIALRLAIFLGLFGAHWFYLGKRKHGLYQLLLCWTGISIIKWIYDIFYILDLQKYEFHYLYNKEFKRATTLEELNDMHDKMLKNKPK